MQCTYRFVIKYSSLKVMAGEYQESTNIDCEGGVCNEEGAKEVRVESLTIHPKYLPKPYWKNDIAIIRFRAPVTESSKL